MKIPLHQLLAGAILASSQFLASPAANAEDKPIAMPDRAKFDPNPSAAGSETSKAVQYGVARKDGAAVKIPDRTMRITNNAGYTVYPIIRARNSTLVTDGNGKDLVPKIGVYDPFDDADVEYRGFIGYQGEDKKYYYGLRKGETIEVTLPVVFWNAGRMGIETGGEYLLHNQTKKPNPLRMDQNAALSITKAKAGDTKGSGVVMWYKALDKDMVAPADDTEDQLVEWTIRDHGFLTDPATAKFSRNQIPDTQLLNLVNYDVSNVDSLYLPVSMQVVDAWMVDQIKGDATGKNWKPGSHPNKLGWTGSTMDEEKLQKQLRRFVEGDKNNPNTLLGQYFGGRGWPYYNFQTGDLSKIKKVKIPSGASLFPQSPLLNVRSNYADGTDWKAERYMLSSGGNDPVVVNIGAEGGQASNRSKDLVLSGGTPAEKFTFLKNIMAAKLEPVIEAHSPNKDANPFPKDTKVTIQKYNPETRTVTLSHNMVNSPDGANFDIFRPREDYAAEALIALWYSWAEYYRAHWMEGNPKATQAPKTYEGTVDPYSAVLVLKAGNADDLGLVEGMAVTANCLKNAQTEDGVHTGEAVILEIAPDKKTLILSQVVDSATPVTDKFTFSPPAELQWTPKTKGMPGNALYPVPLKFDLSKTEKCRDPFQFSKEVYLVMASMNQIGRPNNNTVNKFMQDIIGANMGFIFDKKLHPKDETQTVMAIIRDKIKSVLRGVSDFTEFSDPKDWYPNPAEVAKGYTGDRKFNVFNLDPFVWFIHDVLGFSGYGFSIDDDTADIGASGGTILQVTVTGTKGLANTDQWTAQAPFGPVEFVCESYSGPDLSAGDTQYYDVQDASNTSPIKIRTSQTLLRTLKDGDQVVMEAVQGNTAANSPIDPKTKKPVPFTVKNVGKNTFDLMKPDGTATQGNGVFVKPSGRWGRYPLHPFIDTVTSGAEDELVKVFRRVTGDDAKGTYLGTFVSVNGVDRNPKTGERFRVWQRGREDRGRLILNAPLTDSSGNPLPAQEKIKVRFFGDVSEAK
jgi:hypothetical protein